MTWPCYQLTIGGQPKAGLAPQQFNVDDDTTPKEQRNRKDRRDKQPYPDLSGYEVHSQLLVACLAGERLARHSECSLDSLALQALLGAQLLC